MELPEFIGLSNSASSSAELQTILIRYLSQFGFDRYLMGELYAPQTIKKDEDFGQMVNYPQTWLSHYVAKNYAAHDPVYLRALSDPRPFSWDEAKKSFPSPQSHMVMNEAYECRLRNGLGLSFHLPTGKLIGFGFSSSEQDARTDHEVRNLLYIASVQFYNAYLRMAARQECPIPDLTPREREVLLWLSYGKNKSETAEILTISESCVKRHCESLFRKLDAVNVVAAVVKAIRLGLIDVY